MHHRIVKKLSNIHITGLLTVNQDLPPKHIVERSYISDPKREWVFKELKLNPAFLKYKFPEGEDKESNEYKKLEEDTLNKKLLYRDVICNDCMSFIANFRFHSRIVVDEKEGMKGKLSTYIPHLTTLQELTEEKLQIARKKLDLQYTIVSKLNMLNTMKLECKKTAQQCLSTAEKEVQEQVKSQFKETDAFLDKEIEKTVLDAKLNNCAEKTGNDIQNEYIREKFQIYFQILLDDSILPSFTQNLVFMRWLQIDDLTPSNIGIVGNQIVFFDAEASLLEENEEDYTNRDLNTLLNTELSDVDANEEMKKFLGEEKYQFYKQSIYKAWLKVILCPAIFIDMLTQRPAIAELKDEITRDKQVLLASQQFWQGKLLENEDFISYLKERGDQDFDKILKEYNDAQKLHSHYENPELLNEIKLKYKKLLTHLHELQFKSAESEVQMSMKI